MNKQGREERLRAIREQAERTADDPFPEGTVFQQPGLPRSKVLQVRLNPWEYEAVEQEAARRQLPLSTLVRSWILQRVQEEPTIAELETRLEKVERAVGLRD